MTARRRKPSAAARIRPFWMPLSLAAIAAAGALAAAAMWPGFDVRNVAVVGNRRVSTGEILRRSGVATQRSIWFQNTSAMKRRIEAIPYIQTAAIHRIPPNMLRISVKERSPFAVLESGFETAVVDRQLRVLAPATGLENEPVLVVNPGLVFDVGTFVTARDATELREAYDSMAARQIFPVALAYDRYGGLIVTLDGGVQVLMGQQNDLAKKLTLVQAILTQVVHRQRRVATIDVRAPSTPVVVYR